MGIASHVPCFIRAYSDCKRFGAALNVPQRTHRNRDIWPNLAPSFITLHPSGPSYMDSFLAAHGMSIYLLLWRIKTRHESTVIIYNLTSIFTKVSIILPHRSSLFTLADQATWIHSWPFMACRTSGNKHYFQLMRRYKFRHVHNLRRFSRLLGTQRVRYETALIVLR
jgi:hypothetical protein